MKKLTLTSLIFIISTGYTIQAWAGCAHDNDCKGTRICENGACVYPPEERAPESPATPPTETPPPEAPPEVTPETPAPLPETTPKTAPATNPAAAPNPTDAPAPATEPATGPPLATGDSPAAVPPPVVAAPPTAPATQAVAPSPTEQQPSPPADQPAAPAADSAAATLPPAPEGPQHFKLIYGEVDGVIAFGTAGKMFFFVEDDSDSESLSGPPGGGIRLAIYGAKGSPHNGIYFTGKWSEMKLKGESDSTRSLSVGYTMKKVSTRKGARFRPGFGLDAGLVRTQNTDMANSNIDFENDTYTGLELFPRFTLDIILFNAGNFKMVVPISLGIYVVPFSFMKLLDDPFVLTMFTIVQPAMTIGISFGS